MRVGKRACVVVVIAKQRFVSAPLKGCRLGVPGSTFNKCGLEVNSFSFSMFALSNKKAPFLVSLHPKQRTPLFVLGD